MLALRNVSKYYGDFCALKEINLELTHGVYGLLAPNGAGKTTLIKLLVTLLRPTTGEILYDGQPIAQLDERYRELVGYLPQQFGYYKHYNPRQYLMYIAALKGISKTAAKGRIEELLQLVALEGAANKKMKTFSGGMIQRVGIAQAMLGDPKLLILDEPTAGLDPKERVRFRNLLSELARDRTVILSTHIVSDVESIAGEIIMIKDRRILYQETVEALCSKLEGQVYETLIDYASAPQFRRDVLSLSEKQEQGMLRIRFLSTQRSDPSWQPVRPQLEDLFLDVFRDEEAGGEQ